MNRTSGRLFASAAVIAALTLATAASAQTPPAAPQPWFGVRLPPPLSDIRKATVPMNMASIPPYRRCPKDSAQSGEHILKDVNTIVGFSLASCLSNFP